VFKEIKVLRVPLDLQVLKVPLAPLVLPVQLEPKVLSGSLVQLVRQVPRVPQAAKAPLDQSVLKDRKV